MFSGLAFHKRVWVGLWQHSPSLRVLKHAFLRARVLGLRLKIKGPDLVPRMQIEVLARDATADSTLGVFTLPLSAESVFLLTSALVSAEKQHVSPGNAKCNAPINWT